MKANTPTVKYLLKLGPNRVISDDPQVGIRNEPGGCVLLMLELDDHVFCALIFFFDGR